MNKPKIVGYENDPDSWWSTPMSLDITFTHEGVFVRDGRMVERERRLDPSEIDKFMKDHGMRRVYKPRPFLAKKFEGVYGVKCLVCGFISEKAGELPHDSAERHVRQYHTARSVLL